jgi:hypothetical protein
MPQDFQSRSLTMLRNWQCAIETTSQLTVAAMLQSQLFMVYRNRLPAKHWMRLSIANKYLFMHLADMQPSPNSVPFSLNTLGNLNT